MQRNKIRLALALATLSLGVTTPAQAQWTLGQWNLGSNGHYYSVQAITGSSFDWTIARSQALALIGPNGESVDLATLTTPGENSFVFAGIDSPTYWAIDGAGNNEGPNLGGFQSNTSVEPAGNWAWVTGEAWSFTQWSPGEPNNQGGAENWLTFFSQGSARAGNWNDIGTGTGNSVIRYYVAETTTTVSSAAPEPTTMALLALGGTFALMRRGRRK